MGSIGLRITDVLSSWDLVTWRKIFNQEACVLTVRWVINCPLSLTQDSPVLWQNPQNNNNLTPQLASMKKIPDSLQNPHLLFFTSLYPHPLQCVFFQQLSLRSGASFTTFWFSAGLSPYFDQSTMVKQWGDLPKPRSQEELKLPLSPLEPCLSHCEQTWDAFWKESH